MAKFKAMDPTEKLSYFQVAGIHGMPHITWDDPLHAEPVPSRGYCPHNLVTFPTWHRPYMLLFEASTQRVYEIMVNNVIPTFDISQQALLKAEARKWRLPYWDWAAKKKRGDKEVYDAALILKDRNVTVFTSTGETSILNPMWNFSTSGPMENLGIKPIQYRKNPDKFIDFQLCTATSKVPPSPDAQEWIGGVQNIDAVAKNIQDAKCKWKQEGEGNYTLGAAVYRLLSLDYITSYRQFASARYEPAQNPRDALSLEGIHNNMHMWIGGKWGHMGHIAVAALDPVFWMHHANIDRIFAIYQALYPSKRLSWWVKDETTDTDKDKNEKPLDTEGTMYDSNGVRHIVDLGYTYPELQRWKFDSDIEYRINILAEVRKLYAPPSKILAAPADYIVNVVYERFALGGVPFTVEVLLNDKLVGSVYNFSSTPEALGAIDGCENCLRQQQSKILSSGQITLTGALLASLETLDKEAVRPYLRTHLGHRVVIADGTEIPLSSIPSLQVSVAVGSRLAHIKKDAESIGESSESEGIWKQVVSSHTGIMNDVQSTPAWGAGTPMSQLPIGDSSDSGGTWKPVIGEVTFGDIFAENGTIYDSIEIIPNTDDGSWGEGPVKLALMGYTGYEEVLSL
ncbi:Di-copper centre-containing protein [Mycena venus]|uniref:tyrosinase n=1 Tax=Mycena venus TaxID=2733690 RepID=A0A8H6XHP2_9AGAR|nr:Di-copper centre-containing protein [Mycena venus]